MKIICLGLLVFVPEVGTSVGAILAIDCTFMIFLKSKNKMLREKFEWIFSISVEIS